MKELASVEYYPTLTLQCVAINFIFCWVESLRIDYAGDLHDRVFLFLLNYPRDSGKLTLLLVVFRNDSQRAGSYVPLTVNNCFNIGGLRCRHVGVQNKRKFGNKLNVTEYIKPSE